MSDGYEVLAAGVVRGTSTIDRLSKSSQVVTSIPTARTITLPSRPILYKDYNIRVSSTAATVQLVAALVGNDTTSTVNGQAGSIGIALPPQSTYVARCTVKDPVTGCTWEVAQSKSATTVQLPAASMTLSSDYDGSVMVVDGAAARILNLPSPAIAGRYRFMVKTAGVGTVTLRSLATSVTGYALNLAGATPSALQATAVTDVVIATAALPGTWVEFVSTGGTAAAPAGAYSITGVALTGVGPGLTFA